MSTIEEDQKVISEIVANITDYCFNLTSTSVNYSDCFNYDYSKDSNDANYDPFEASVYIQILWTIFFSLMVISAIIGNLIVIIIILTYEQMRSKTNYFLLNLSIADIMMAIFNTMFNFIFMLKNHWPFGYYYCKVNNFLSTLATASSVFTITATSAER